MSKRTYKIDKVVNPDYVDVPGGRFWGVNSVTVHTIDEPSGPPLTKRLRFRIWVRNKLFRFKRKQTFTLAKDKSFINKIK